MTRKSTVTALLRLANATHGPTSVHELGAYVEPPDHDHLASGDRLRRFLGAYEIPMPPGRPAESQLDAMRVVRSAIRDLAEGASQNWRRSVGPLLDGYHFRLRLDGRLVPIDAGWDGFIADRLRELVLLAADPRGLRLCQAETCRWLFLDDTRNQRRRWCDMGTCGSRAKMRRYRARTGGSSTSGPPRRGRQAHGSPRSRERHMTTERSALEPATPDGSAPNRSDVLNWIRGITARAALGTITEITEVHATPWSTVLAVTVSAERLYFKAVWPPQRHEVSTTVLLATHSPGDVPPVRAAHEDRGWMLLADAGEPLKLRDRASQVALLAEAVRQYAALQVAWAPRVEALRSAGVPDRRDLRPHLDRLLLAYPSQRQDTLTDAELALLRDLARDVASMEQHLGAVQPASIEHGDLHTGNILVDGDDRMRVFDWGDVSIASPFLSLAVLLESLEDSLGVVTGDASFDRIVEEYLAPFRLRDGDDVAGLVGKARLLGSISRAVTWDHVATHVPPEDRAAYPDPVASSLRDCLRLVAA